MIRLAPMMLDHLASISPPGRLASMLDLIGSIWQLSDSKNSLYFRGSFSRSHRRHVPLDVDMYYVLNSDDPALPATEEICIELHARFPDLPRPDLSIFTKANLLNPDLRQMTRLILIHDGTHICGENLLPVIPPVAFTEESAEIIWYKQSEIVAKKLLGLAKTDVVLLDPDLLKYFRTSVAKSVLRLVMHVFMLGEAAFTRDVIRCAAHIRENYPCLSKAVDEMLVQIDGRSTTNVNFQTSANLLFASLRWKANGAQGSQDQVV